MQEPKVGDIVYPSYTPAKAGKVIRVYGPFKDHADLPYLRWAVDVRMPNGKEWSENNALNIRLLDDLLDETVKKLQTHTKKMRDCQKI